MIPIPQPTLVPQPTPGLWLLHQYLFSFRQLGVGVLSAWLIVTSLGPRELVQPRNPDQPENFAFASFVIPANSMLGVYCRKSGDGRGGRSMLADPQAADSQAAEHCVHDHNVHDYSADGKGPSPGAQPLNQSGISDPVSDGDPFEIHNFRRLSKRVWSGSEPHGEQSFRSLADLGVRTIVSVDGAMPEVDIAMKYGIRYVHIPFGYDAIPIEQQHQLIRVMQDTAGPVFFHCHHGRHRGPAAAAIACRVEGTADAQQAEQILRDAGTSKEYAGLWRDVKEFRRPADDVVLPELVAVAKVQSLAVAMARISRSFDALTDSQADGWQTAGQSKGFSAAQQSLLLQEELHEAWRNSSADYDDAFRAWMKESEQLARELNQAISDSKPAVANARLASIKTLCSKCHQAYRN